MLRTSHFFSLSSSSPIPHQLIMDTQPPQPGPSGSESSQLAGASSNTSLSRRLHGCRHQSVHQDVANAATKNMTQDAHLKIICKTVSSTYKKQHAVGCEYIDTVVNGRHFTVCHVAGVCRELDNQFIAVCNGKRQWSTKAFAHTVSKFEHHDVDCSVIFMDEFRDKGPQV